MDCNARYIEKFVTSEALQCYSDVTNTVTPILLRTATVFRKRYNVTNFSNKLLKI